MDTKESFKTLVETVVLRSRKTQEQLAVEMGYGKNYISDVLTPKGHLSKKFIEAFKQKYAEVLSEHSSEQINAREVIDQLKLDKEDLKQDKAVYLDIIKKNLASIGVSLAKLVEIQESVSSAVPKKAVQGDQSSLDVNNTFRHTGGLAGKSANGSRQAGKGNVPSKDKKNRGGESH